MKSGRFLFFHVCHMINIMSLFMNITDESVNITNMILDTESMKTFYLRVTYVYYFPLIMNEIS